MKNELQQERKKLLLSAIDALKVRIERDERFSNASYETETDLDMERIPTQTVTIRVDFPVRTYED